MQAPERALDRADSRVGESTFYEFLSELFGMMEERRREVAEVARFVAMLADFEVLLHDPDEMLVVNQSACEAIERGGEARDRHGHQNAPAA